MVTFGQGVVTSFSQRQKPNTESSTEAEFINIDDTLPQILWTRYFLEEQVYNVVLNTLFQDNKGAIVMETKRKTTNSKDTKHIKVRYFFITDKVNNKEVTLGYCPTEQMWADILTKSLQGANSAI